MIVNHKELIVNFRGIEMNRLTIEKRAQVISALVEGNSLRSTVRMTGVAMNIRKCASKAKLERLAPHDLRRTCARLCHESGGELEQIQFLLGHVSVQTTERYLGCKQRLREAVNDKIGLETVGDSPGD